MIIILNIYFLLINLFIQLRNRKYNNNMGTSSNNEQNKDILIWIDPKIENQENSYYVKTLRIIYNISLKLFINVDEAFNYMKNI